MLNKEDSMKKESDGLEEIYLEYCDNTRTYDEFKEAIRTYLSSVLPQEPMADREADYAIGFMDCLKSVKERMGGLNKLIKSRIRKNKETAAEPFSITERGEV
jgi:hypothetical protein